MTQLHPDYVCKCDAPHLQKYLGENTGICEDCNLIYDEDLYERRLRQHVKNWHYDSIHDYLLEVSPDYRRLNRGT